jgi:hypothetical protein
MFDTGLRLVGALVLGLLCASQTQAAICSQGDVAPAAERVTATRNTLLALPIGDGQQTDVSAAARQAIASMKQGLDELLRAYVRCQPQSLDAKKADADLAKLVLPAPAPQGVLVNGKRVPDDDHYGYQVSFDARRPASQHDLLAIAVRFQIECGEDAVLTIFAFANGTWTEVLRAQSKPYTSISAAWASFDYVISPSDDSGRWYVLTKTVAPWCSSTWSMIDYSVLRPAPQTIDPKMLLSRSDSIWWGSDDFGTLTANKNDFDIRFHAESIDTGVHNRVWVRHFRIEGDTIERIPPVALSPRDFVDEWIVSPWDEAMAWSNRSAKPDLAKMHAKLSQHKFHDSFNYDSATRCPGPAPLYQIAVDSDETNENFYFVVSGDGGYRMDAVSTTPAPSCRGPNILDKMATQ